MAVATKLYKQPEAVDNIAATLVSMLKDHHDHLQVARPNYAAPVGVEGNLFRTSLFLDEKQSQPEDIGVVHLSNVAYDNGGTQVAVFGNMAGVTVRTISYQGALTMAGKEHPVSNLMCRDIANIHSDIASYLVEGKLPQ